MTGAKPTSELSLSERLAALAPLIVERQFSENPDLAARYGERGRRHCLADATYHLSFLAESIVHQSPALFLDYLRWVRSMLEARGVPRADLLRQIETIRDVVLPAFGLQESLQLSDLLNAGLSRLRREGDELPCCLAADAPHAELAGDYLNALLTWRRQDAAAIVLAAVTAGVPIPEIYLHVFQPVQIEIGRLWQLARIGVGDEHYASATTQWAMSQLYPYLFAAAAPRIGRTMVMTCVPGELHEIGARMVADFFEMAGWDTIYLGANMPVTGVLDALEKHGADVLGVSATMPSQISAVVELVATVRRSALGARVRTLVGGYPFVRLPELRQLVAADAIASDAQEALLVTQRLVGSA